MDAHAPRAGARWSLGSISIAGSLAGAMAVSGAGVLGLVGAGCARRPAALDAPAAAPDDVAAVTPAGPPTPGGATAAPWLTAWPQPDAIGDEDGNVAVPAGDCFAYSRDRRAYACLGYEYGPEVDLTAHPDGVATGFVDVIGTGGPLVESHAVWSSAGQAVEPRAAVEDRLRALGLGGAPTALRRVRLAPGVPVAVGSARLRYDLRLHEGDASFEYFGDVVVVCGDGRGRELEVRERGLELGDDAWLTAAPGAPVVAVTVHGVDGGEGVEDHWLNTIVIDPAAACAGAAGGVAGPVESRSQGP